MDKYLVNIAYFLPEFEEVEVEANNKEEAEDKAWKEFEKLFPEALDPAVTFVKQV